MPRFRRLLPAAVLTALTAASVLFGVAASAAPIQMPPMGCQALTSPRLQTGTWGSRVTLQERCGDTSTGFLSCVEVWNWSRPAPDTLRLDNRTLSCLPETA